jgi:hypothetical protein
MLKTGLAPVKWKATPDYRVGEGLRYLGLDLISGASSIAVTSIASFLEK